MKYCIFVERIFDDEYFSKLIGFLKNKKPEDVKLFCMTPANYTLAIAEQGYEGSKNKLSDTMFVRYKDLQALGFKIELHLHLSLSPKNMRYELQEEMFEEATQWMKENGFFCKQIAFGWYAYSEISLAIAKRLGLEHFEGRRYWHFHDYESPKQLGVVLSNIKHFVLGFKK